MEPVSIQGIEYSDQLAYRHFTEAYTLFRTNENTPIYRRGYTFFLTIEFDRPFNVKTDVLRVEFNFGPSPRKRDITNILLVLRPKQPLPSNPYQWGIALEPTEPKDDKFKVTLNIQIAANAPVGAWSCTAHTNIRDKREVAKHLTASRDFYVLFNPWSTADTVYMKNDTDRNEYILNDRGKIWVGTSSSPQGREWYFGQFEPIALTTSLFLLDKSSVAPEDRGDAIKVSRGLSAIINSDDDEGLLIANFNGNYSGGTPPNLWTGSLPILTKYYNSGGAPVRYGQCWVFSAVTVTICRALGIPCRSTTVYGAGQGSTNIIRYYDVFGNLTDDNNAKDALCSFHAWNEVWLARKKYSGWQIIDTTPLRRSEGIMRCGPAPVEAVRQGDRDYQYDTDFIFDILNAEIRTDIVDDNSDAGEHELPKNGYRSARSIVTKAIGSDEPWNVTPFYKDLEEIKVDDNDKVTYRIVTNRVPYGETLTVTVEVTNNSSSTKNIWSVLGGASKHYTGKRKSEVDQRHDHFSVRSGEVLTVLPPFSIPASTYIPALEGNDFFSLYAFAVVEENGKRGESWAEEEDIIFIQPMMKVRADKSDYTVGETVNVEVSFQNPVNVPLTGCFYMVDGPSDEFLKEQPFKDVGPLDLVRISVSFVAGNRVGQRIIYVNFVSRQLPYIGGSELINIRPKRNIIT